MPIDPRDLQLIFVEYFDGHPIGAVIATPSGGHETWDMDWCKRDRATYTYLSGFGAAGPISIGRFVEQPKPGQWRIWLAPGVRIQTNALTPRPLSQQAIEKMGCLFFSQRPRPFTAAMDDETADCAKCNDRLPVGALCAHVGFCTDCGDFYSDHYWRHRWHERNPAQVEIDHRSRWDRPSLWEMSQAGIERRAGGAR